MKTNPEFEKFTGFMDKLAKVPNSEVKAALEGEKAEKWLKRQPKMQLSKGSRFIQSGPVQPLVKAFNQALKEERRRKLN